MALFTLPFYLSQNTPPATSFFQQPPNLNLPTVNNTKFHNSMKRRRGKEDNGPSPKRKHYEDRMSQRLDSLDLSNSNPPPLIGDIHDNELGIYEMDPEILDDSPQSLGDDFDQPIVEEPDDDGDKEFVISNELQNFIKNVKNDNILSKFHKKSGHELVLWRPLPLQTISSLTSSDNTSSSFNDRITEVEEDEDIDIEDIADGIGQSHVSFPEESSSTRSSASPPLGSNNSDHHVLFSSMSSSASSTSSSDGQHPIRMPTSTFHQNAMDYEPMEMD